jgi:hypothetical protein
LLGHPLGITDAKSHLHPRFLARRPRLQTRTSWVIRNNTANTYTAHNIVSTEDYTDSKNPTHFVTETSKDVYPDAGKYLSEYWQAIQKSYPQELISAGEPSHFSGKIQAQALKNSYEFDKNELETNIAALKVMSAFVPFEAFVGELANVTFEEAGYLYRFDTRSPEQISAAGGFVPRGKNMDLFQHVLGEGEASGFVATSSDLNALKSQIVEGKEGFIYKIKPQTKGIDVNATLGAKSIFPLEHEIAIPGTIKASDIVGSVPFKR